MLWVENIGWLQVTMNDVVIVDWLVPVDDLLEHWQGLRLWKSFLAFDGLGQVLVAKFSDYVDVVLGVVDVEQLNDVFLIPQLLQDVDFVIKKLFVQISFDKLEIDQLYCYFLI